MIAFQISGFQRYATYREEFKSAGGPVALACFEPSEIVGSLLIMYPSGTVKLQMAGMREESFSFINKYIAKSSSIVSFVGSLPLWDSHILASDPLIIRHERKTPPFRRSKY